MALIDRDVAIKEFRNWWLNIIDNREPKQVIMELPTVELEEDCDTCKHGYFGDSQCENCRVRYPSNYERRADERQT